MQTNRVKYEVRAEWLKLSLSDRSPKKGKKRFTVHKNVNSEHFHSTLHPNPEVPKHQNPFPPVAQTTKSLHNLPQRKEAEVQVSADHLSVLHQRLKEKDTQIKVLQNMFSHSTNRLKPNPQSFISKRRNSSIVEDPILSHTNEKLPIVRHGSLPSLKPTNYLKYSSHPAFMQPKFTHKHPKLILSNPITGVIFPYS